MKKLKPDVEQVCAAHLASLLFLRYLSMVAAGLNLFLTTNLTAGHTHIYTFFLLFQFVNHFLKDSDWIIQCNMGTVPQKTQWYIFETALEMEF